MHALALHLHTHGPKLNGTKSGSGRKIKGEERGGEKRKHRNRKERVLWIKITATVIQFMASPLLDRDGSNMANLCSFIALL